MKTVIPLHAWHRVAAPPPPVSPGAPQCLSPKASFYLLRGREASTLEVQSPGRSPCDWFQNNGKKGVERRGSQGGDGNTKGNQSPLEQSPVSMFWQKSLASLFFSSLAVFCSPDHQFFPPFPASCPQKERENTQLHVVRPGFWVHNPEETNCSHVSSSWLFTKCTHSLELEPLKGWGPGQDCPWV